MARAELIRSSGFKTAVLFLLLFLGAAAMAGTAAYLIIRQELVHRHRRAVDQDFAFFADLYKASGEEDLVSTLQVHAQSVRAKDRVYILRGPDGTPLAGNVTLPGALPPTGEMSGSAFGIPVDYDYDVRTGKLGELSLLVGRSAEDVSEIEEVFLKGAFWAGLLLVAISLAGGVALSHRMNQRISEIQRALEKVAEGRFDVPMPVNGRGDDIDRIAGLIDGAVKRLGDAVEANRQIASDIAHDLRTPMSRLRISVEKALDLEAAGGSARAELEAIDAESRTILATFDALLRIAQIEAGARKARFSPVDVAGAFSDVAEFYATHAEEMGGSLKMRIAPDVPAIQGDRELLIQLFANLIENALKHAGPRPGIDCTIASEDGTVVVSVCDDGAGIPAEERDKVLRRLYRLEKSRTTPGTGLGLAMVKAIADLHGARLELSDNQPGLRVQLIFPVGEARSDLGESGPPPVRAS